MSMTVGGTSGLVFPDGSNQLTGWVPGMRNRIINGAMMIDQRNAGALVSAMSGYAIDRWQGNVVGGGVCSVQRVSDAPAGFVNSVKLTLTTADTSVAADDYMQYMQQIEGVNCADLGFGTANAQTVTVSFWVKSSVAGAYSFSLRNGTANRSIVSNYTINSANTWEYKTITFAGDTTGTWDTGNATGVYVTFVTYQGSTGQTTANTWTAGNYRAGTGISNTWAATVGNTFQLTGVQLEKGSTATSFDYRPYGTELALCQRYYQVRDSASGVAATAANFVGTVPFAVDMRSAPSVGLTAALQVTDTWSADFTQSSTSIVILSGRVSTRSVNINCGNFAGMTQGRPIITNTAAGGSITLSAEL